MTRTLMRFLLVAPFLFFMACERHDAPPPGTLVVALDTGPRTLDPRIATDAASSKVRDLLFNGLVARGDDFSLVPDLAESWRMVSSTEYRFTLRKGITFHNGQPLTSKDVAATFSYVLDEKNRSPYRGGLLVIDAMETPDAATIIFRLKEPNAPFLGALTLGVVPAGAGEEMGERPMGTGPFFFVSQKREEEVRLKKFDACFGGAPKMDEVVFRIVPDETVRTLELESGRVHIITNPITPDLLPRLRKNDRLKVITRLGSNFSYLGFNLEDGLTGDIAVRRALAHAIDRRSVITYLLKGLAHEASGLLSPANRFYHNGVEKFSYNPALAKKILDAAGYRDPDGDGPEVRFTLRYSTSQNELRKRIAEVFQWQLAKIGVGLDIRSYEWGTFYGDIKKGNFQIFSLTWVGIVDPDIYHYIFHTASFPPDGANRGRYHNDTIDTLLEHGRRVTGKERTKTYALVQEIIAADLPYIPLWHVVNVAVINKRVHDFRVAPDENLKSLKDVFLESEKGR